ncbi:ABC transporter substrate-binding protein [Boudabousia marimammalium]|uniref:ABC transporter substrate-binding protein n=1 Tax=Boudabousia marimammalium TaxID=156892 RepID=A0A1Q5PKI7_9ACTO|nr:extracellular solute-binding protein [Boudabousia marimammalium]OKL46729.1 hypothetical protein BM477_07195 [Boudabousia marimammalium]
MRISKKVPAMLAVLALSTAGLAACSSDDKAGDAGKTMEPSGKAVEIEYWHRLPDQDGMVKVAEAADEFNKANPNIKVKTTKFEGKADQSYDKITAAVKAGNAPCLAQADYGNVPAMLVRGELMDVTDMVAQYKDKYAAGPWGQVSPGGKTYGIPQDTGPLVYYYDKDAFDALGLKAPTTWDEYWANAKKAKEAGKASSVFLGDEAGDWFAAVQAAAGNAWFSLAGDAWKVEANSDASKKVAETWQASIDSGDTLVVDRWGDPAPFDQNVKEGKIIGYIGAAWEAAFNLGSLGKDAANWQVAQMPDAKSGPWGGSAIVVLKGCKHPEEALKYADWYNTNLKAMTSQGLVPAAKGDAPTDEKVMKLYGGQNVMAELQKAADLSNPNWIYIPTWPAVKTSLVNNMKAGVKLSENVDKAQEEAVKSLEQAGLSVAK